MFFDIFKRTTNVSKNYNVKTNEEVLFDDKINLIKKAQILSEKLSASKDVLVNTDFILKKDALSIFDDDKWSYEQNYLKKFLEYKDSSSMIYGRVDCDVSLFCIIMYVLLSKQLSVNNIMNQYGSKVKYEIRDNENRFKGDTLTSALHPLKLYLGSLWKQIDNDDNLKKNKKYAAFQKLFNSVARTGIPVAPTGEWNEYCLEHSDTIWKAMDEPAKQFLKCYTMFGNYMRIPGNSYQIGNRMWTSFNMARSNKGKWDTVDTLLAKIYSYYKWNETKYLEDIFTVKQEEIAVETLNWLNEFNGWDDFLDKNCLYSFVDSNTLIPISMKTGKVIKIDELKKYDAIPRDYQEFLVFFEQLSKRIISRTKSIYEKISSKM